jgi:hypothetical protein
MCPTSVSTAGQGGKGRGEESLSMCLSPPAPLVELISGLRQWRQAEDGEREDWKKKKEKKKEKLVMSV